MSSAGCRPAGSHGTPARTRSGKHVASCGGTSAGWGSARSRGPGSTGSRRPSRCRRSPTCSGDPARIEGPGGTHDEHNPDRDALRDRFAEVLLAAARSLQPGSDPEFTLEARVEAAGVVQEKLRQELAELRVEQGE